MKEHFEKMKCDVKKMYGEEKIQWKFCFPSHLPYLPLLLTPPLWGDKRWMKLQKINTWRRLRAMWLMKRMAEEERGNKTTKMKNTKRWGKDGWWIWEGNWMWKGRKRKNEMSWRWVTYEIISWSRRIRHEKTDVEFFPSSAHTILTLSILISSKKCSLAVPTHETYLLALPNEPLEYLKTCILYDLAKVVLRSDRTMFSFSSDLMRCPECELLSLLRPFSTRAIMVPGQKTEIQEMAIDRVVEL